MTPKLKVEQFSFDKHDHNNGETTLIEYTFTMNDGSTQTLWAIDDISEKFQTRQAAVDAFNTQKNPNS